MATATQPHLRTHNTRESLNQVEAPLPIWEMVAQIGSQISDEDWQKVPEDSSVNYKHHLYGAQDDALAKTE